MISLASEMTDSKGRHARGWLFFDAECEFCRKIARFLAVPMARHGLAVAPLQDPRVGVLLGLSRDELLRTVRFVSADGSQYEGADALLAVARLLPCARPLIWISRIPGVMSALRSGYGWGAQRWRCPARHCMAERIS